MLNGHHIIIDITLKPNESIVTDKLYQSQIMGDLGISISIRIDKHNSTATHNSPINT